LLGSNQGWSSLTISPSRAVLVVSYWTIVLRPGPLRAPRMPRQ